MHKTYVEKLARRIGEMKAITAIARKLLVVVWHVLTNQEADRHADLARTERKLLNWATRHRLATSTGMSRAEFVNRAMQYLGVTPASKETAMPAPALEPAG